MKLLLLRLSFNSISLYIFCQEKVLLIDRYNNNNFELKNIEALQVIGATVFPIKLSDFDSLISKVNQLRNLKESGLERKIFNEKDFLLPSIRFEIRNIVRKNGDGYYITMYSLINNSEYSLVLSDPLRLLPQYQAYIREFLSPLKKIRAKIYETNNR